MPPSDGLSASLPFRPLIHLHLSSIHLPAFMHGLFSYVSTTRVPFLVQAFGTPRRHVSRSTVDPWSSGSASALPPSARCISVLQPQVLRDVLPSEPEGAWHATRDTLVSFFLGERLKAHKANVVLFACGTDASCSETASLLLGADGPGCVVPVDVSVDALDLIDDAPLSAAADPAEARRDRDAAHAAIVQTTLTNALRVEPASTVVVTGLDAPSVGALRALLAATSEHGGFEWNGKPVQTIHATFFFVFKTKDALLWTAEEDVAAAAAVKRDLVDRIQACNPPEGLAGSVRRRIDLVVKVDERLGAQAA